MSHSIQRQIHAVARRARRLLVVHGLCWFIVTVVSVAFVFGWVDYSLRLQDRGVRVILSTSFALTLLWSFRRFVAPSIRRTFSELEVAQQVERRFPQLGDRLSSSLDFLRGSNDATQAESAKLRQTVISETETLVHPLDFTECLNTRATRRSLLACIPLVMAIGIVCCSDLDATSLAARRMAVPWSGEAWPRWNSLEFVNPPERIALGQDFVIELTDRRGHLPRDAKLQFWFDGDDEDELDTATMQRGDDRFHFTRSNVTRAFKYRAVGGDDDSMAWLPLEVVEPARIEDFQITVEPPAYSGISSTKSPVGPIRVLQDSTLVISGRTDRPVQSVRGYVASGENVEAFHAQVDSSNTAFELSTLPTDTPIKGHFWIELIEDDGVISQSNDRVNWEILEDQAPKVVVSAPTADMYFTPDAIVPLRVTGTDELAIHTLNLRVRDTMIPLFVGPEVSPTRDELPAHADVRKVARELNLSEFELTPNETLEIAFVARDYKPQPSEMVTRSLSIISRDDFDYRSQEKQKLLLARLVEALRLQRATRSQVASLQTQMETVGSLSDDDAGQLRASELQQQRVARLLDDRPGGAAQIIADLLASMSSNQSPDSEATLRMKRLSDALDAVNRHRLPDLLSEFIRATKSARGADRDSGATEAFLASIGSRQDVIANDLQSMIDQLSQWDDYRRFARDVARLLRAQQEVSTQVDQLPTIGKRLEALSPQERADLARASGEQLDLARRFDRIQAAMNQLENQIRESDPSAAQALAEAVREASTHGIAEQMRQVGDDVAQNRLGNASKTQSEVERGLQQVLDVLTDSTRREPRDSSPQQVAAALAQLKTNLIGIAARQQVLLDATAQWQDLGVSSQTPSQMSHKQQQLAERTKDAREQMPIPKAFAFGMTTVETSMSDAAKLLEQEPPNERVRRLQGRSLSRLQQLLAALNSQVANGNDSTGDGASNRGNESAAGSSGEQLASLGVEELRLLHAMQLDIYERTVALEQRRQEPEGLKDEGQQELQRLALEQGQLAALLTEALPAEESSDRTDSPDSSNEAIDGLDDALKQAGDQGSGADE
ncbi:MAG: hypothetical protein H8E66_30210 [Planctomycetes bacterium]|nr:hypothetical protein [Planctomycetota bacterium]